MNELKGDPLKTTEASFARRFALRRFAAAALLFALTGTAAACAGAETTADDEPLEVESGDVAGSPENYVDSSVSVSGELGELLGGRAFTLAGGGFLGGNEELSVISAIPLEEAVQGAEVGEFGPRDAGEFVQVEGVVREFEDVEELEDLIGTGVSDEFFDEYVSEPVLIANQVLLDPDSSEERGKSDEPAARAGGPTIFDLTQNPDDYYGVEVSIDGEVEDTLDGEAFRVSGPGVGSGKGIVIVGEDGTVPEVSEGDAVRVTGEFREFDEAEFERELNITFDDELYVAYGLQPSIIATQIEQL